jgi:hypothetical protein
LNRRSRSKDISALWLGNKTPEFSQHATSFQNPSNGFTCPLLQLTRPILTAIAVSFRTTNCQSSAVCVRIPSGHCSSFSFEKSLCC